MPIIGVRIGWRRLLWVTVLLICGLVLLGSVSWKVAVGAFLLLCSHQGEWHEIPKPPPPPPKVDPEDCGDFRG